MHQTTHFFNLGYGWLCKHCSAAAAELKQRAQHNHTPQQPQPLALAKWTDEKRNGLTCPRCGIEELIRGQTDSRSHGGYA